MFDSELLHLIDTFNILYVCGRMQLICTEGQEHKSDLPVCGQ